MNSISYKVCRDNVYVGKVIKINTNENIQNRHQVLFHSIECYRSMLFTLTKKKLANDLLYQSPYYPVLGMTDNEEFAIPCKDIIVVKNAYNLEELLRYFGYNEELNYKDILDVRKKFFSDRFAKDNCELFGQKEIFESSIPNKPISEINSKEDKREAKLREKTIDAGYRFFMPIKESVLSRELWYVLNGNGNLTRADIVAAYQMTHFILPKDVFLPPKNEKNVKKLSRIRKSAK